MSSDADIKRAMDAIGIKKLKKAKDKRKVDEWLLNERWDKESQRKPFQKALKNSIRDGVIDKNDRTQWALDQTLGAESAILYDRQSKKQQDQLQGQYDQMRADQQASSEAQQKMMEEMMNQPVYMPKQQGMPMVQKPQVKDDPLLPAPAPNTPMSIAAPPAPELTTTGNRMAIVRTPRSTQARKRRATQGTSNLTNY